MRIVLFILASILSTTLVFAGTTKVELRVTKDNKGNVTFYRYVNSYSKDGILTGFENGGDILEALPYRKIISALKGTGELEKLVSPLKNLPATENTFSLGEDEPEKMDPHIRILMYRLTPLEKQDYSSAYVCIGGVKVGKDQLINGRVDSAVGRPTICY